MDNNINEKSIKETWKKLKGVFASYSKLKNKKFSIDEYLEELSIYTDKLIEDLENKELLYKKGFCEFALLKESEDIQLSVILFFSKKNSGELIDKKELRRYLKREIFLDEVIDELKTESKRFEIVKG